MVLLNTQVKAVLDFFGVPYQTLEVNPLTKVSQARDSPEKRGDHQKMEGAGYGPASGTPLPSHRPQLASPLC